MSVMLVLWLRKMFPYRPQDNVLDESDALPVKTTRKVASHCTQPGAELHAKVVALALQTSGETVALVHDVLEPMQDPAMRVNDVDAFGCRGRVLTTDKTMSWMKVMLSRTDCPCQL
jgi:hypothetical protein